jgi:mono/diheme cytochrome c family protein
MSPSSTSWFARLGFVPILLLGLGWTARPALAQAGDAYHPAPRDTIGVEPYQGWKQYELNCSRCHGEFGVGSSFAPALVVSLTDSGSINTKELFIQTVCAGRPAKGMPSWCALGLEMDKIQNIYAYLKGRADGKIHLGRPAARAAPSKSES